MKATLLLIFLIAISIDVFAEKALSFGITSWPPFMISDDQKPPSGISVDLINKISERENLAIKIGVFPWSRILLMLESGELDCIPLIAKNKQREEYLTYTVLPYYQTTSVFYVKKGRSDTLNSYVDLYQFTIGTTMESEYFEPFNSDVKIKKETLVTTHQLYEMLVLDRIDAFIGTHPQVGYDIALNGYSEKFEQAQYAPNNDVPLYIACSKKSPNLDKLTLINRAMDQLIKEGFIEELVSNYLR